MTEFAWPPGTLLGGVVGSTAYGLSRGGSDVDRLGVRAASWRELSGLTPPLGKRESSWTTTDPDSAVHEALKFCHLALGCNPTVLELLCLPEYEVCTRRGEELRGIRESFLTRLAVRRAYLGYATQQFERLVNRGDGSFSADTRKRTSKHARHLRRLLRQGVQLHNTGRLTLLVERPEEYFEFGERVAAGEIKLAERELRRAEELMDAGVARSPLGEEPNRDEVERWLRSVRTDASRRGLTT